MINSQNLLRGFIAIGIIYCVLLIAGFDSITYYMKPFLLPFLFYSVVKDTGFKTKKWLLAALLFSWVGDCFLLFTEQGQLYFILGLVAFLIAHIFLIVLFTKQKSDNQSFRKGLFWLGVAVATLYLVSILSLLLPSLGDLTFPVIIYALTITIMLKTALKGIFDWKQNSKYIVLIGAAFFVTSDSILAINKFHAPLPLASFWIMLTYLMAQFFITDGIVKLNKNAPV